MESLSANYGSEDENENFESDRDESPNDRHRRDRQQNYQRDASSSTSSSCVQKTDDTNYEHVHMDMSEDSQGSSTDGNRRQSNKKKSAIQGKDQHNSSYDSNHKDDKSRRDRDREKDRYKDRDIERKDRDLDRKDRDLDRKDRDKGRDRYSKNRDSRYRKDNRDRTRDRSRDRDRDRSRDRDRDRDRDRRSYRDKERDRDKYRDRKDRYSRDDKYDRRRSVSPKEKKEKLETQSKSPQQPPPPLIRELIPSHSVLPILTQSPASIASMIEKAKGKVQQLEKLGIDISNTTAKPCAVEIPSYYNPGVINPNKYADQMQKRKLLWSNKKAEQETTAKWEGAKFAADSDGKVASKFMRLMGIKDPPPAKSSTSNESGNSKSHAPDLTKKQEDMFSTMEQQYEVARQVTHTMRGVGLGFGSQPRQF